MSLIFVRLCVKKSRELKFFGLSLDRFLESILPAFEKILSHGQLVEGMHKYFLVKRYKFGNENLFFSHQANISPKSVSFFFQTDWVTT